MIISLEATGETISFTKSADDTNGEAVEMLVTIPANSEGPPPHRHILQTETFVAIEGTLRLLCGNKEITLRPGEEFVVPKNTTHTFYASEGGEIRFKAVFSPALNIQYLLSEVFESCNRNKSKSPSIFDAAFIFGECKGEYALSNIPMMVQRMVFPVIAIIGRTLHRVAARPKSYL